MPLSPQRAVEQARIMYEYRTGELAALDLIRRYWKGRQALPTVIPNDAPAEVKTMARIARVNMIKIVVDTFTQSLFVDGFRSKGEAADHDLWNVWQRNRMDARQTGIHRAATAYGTSYAVVLPGDPVPVIRGRSPRQMTCVYGEDPDWPMWAFEKLGRGLWRLYDDEASYYISGGPEKFEFTEHREHGAGVTPVVRFIDEDDLDDDDDVDESNSLAFGRYRDLAMRGQVAPLMSIQDQIDITTFSLLGAQWYSAFRQRWSIGWTPEKEEEKKKAGASQFWTFDREPDEMKIGEFEQTILDGYIKSREASLKHGATLSQTPVHELIGELVNLSAEALSAAEAGRDRKVDERQTLHGEAHEQIFWLVGHYTGVEIPVDAQVRWRDTSARAFAATVDALGKLAQMLKIPPQELWERIPGVTHQDIERWKTAAQAGDSLALLSDLLGRQNEPPVPTP